MIFILFYKKNMFVLRPYQSLFIYNDADDLNSADLPVSHVIISKIAESLVNIMIMWKRLS